MEPTSDLNRLAEAKAVREKQVTAKLDVTADHADIYAIAFLEGDTEAMPRQVEWAKGKPDEFDVYKLLLKQRRQGKLQAAREAYARAVDVAHAGKFEEIASGSWRRMQQTKRLWDMPRKREPQRRRPWQ